MGAQEDVEISRALVEQTNKRGDCKNESNKEDSLLFVDRVDVSSLVHCGKINGRMKKRS